MGADLSTYIIIAILVLLSGLFSGLNLGLMSLTPHQLLRKIRLGDKRAKKIYPLRKNGNLLLITLLLGNVVVNSVLAIFLGSITVGVVAVLLSTGLIVVFGEIIPQAFFARHALTLGSKVTWIVWIFLITLYPISKPMALVLDFALGREMPTIFSRRELRLFLKEQKKSNKTGAKKYQFNIMEGALELSNTKVSEVMTPRVKVFFLKENQILNKNLLGLIHKKGFTRIPVFKNSRDKIVGILYSKDLISLDPGDKIKVKEIMRPEYLTIRENEDIEKAIYKAKENKIHLFVVKSKSGGVEGIVTLEDILEEMVGEIIDEYDLIEQAREKMKKG